jgi:hypothetical protein
VTFGESAVRIGNAALEKRIRRIEVGCGKPRPFCRLCKPTKALRFGPFR